MLDWTLYSVFLTSYLVNNKILIKYRLCLLSHMIKQWTWLFKKFRRRVDDKLCTLESISNWIQKRQWTFSFLLTFVFVLLRGKFWYPDPPQRTMGTLLSFFLPNTRPKWGAFPPPLFFSAVGGGCRALRRVRTSWRGPLSGVSTSLSFPETQCLSLFLNGVRAQTRCFQKSPKSRPPPPALSSHRPSNLFFCFQFCFFLPILVLFFTYLLFCHADAPARLSGTS